MSVRGSSTRVGDPLSAAFMGPAVGLVTQYRERAIFECHDQLPRGQQAVSPAMGLVTLWFRG